jgi:hypothetical protein
MALLSFVHFRSVFIPIYAHQVQLHHLYSLPLHQHYALVPFVLHEARSRLGAVRCQLRWVSFGLNNWR